MGLSIKQEINLWRNTAISTQIMQQTKTIEYAEVREESQPVDTYESH